MDYLLPMLLIAAALGFAAVGYWLVALNDRLARALGRIAELEGDRSILVRIRERLPLSGWQATRAIEMKGIAHDDFRRTGGKDDEAAQAVVRALRAEAAAGEVR